MIAALAVVVLAMAGCGSATGPDDASPGYRDRDREVDRSPFTLAQPTTTSGPTTLPSTTGPSDSEIPDGPSTTTSSTTTTTPLPTDPAIPDVDIITSICGFERTVESFHGLNFEGPAEAEELLIGLPSVLSAYLEAAPAAAVDDLAALVPAFEGLRDVVAANGWDATSTPVEQALEELAAGALPDQINRIVQVEKSVCT